MSDSAQLSRIVDLCIQIDQAAVELYASLSTSAGSEALKGFWDKMATEGQSHLEYWHQLKTLAAYDELPQAFDNPESVITELKERAQQIQKLRNNGRKTKL